MGKIARDNRVQAQKDVGSLVILQKTITSSTITVAAQDLSSVATGAFYIEDIICETDATGLAGATNFLVGTNNAYGIGPGMTTGLANFETAVSGLGAVATIAIRNAGPDCSNDKFPSVTGVCGTLSAGKKLQFAGTATAGTGAGKVRVTVVLRRIDAFASISVV